MIVFFAALLFAARPQLAAAIVLHWTAVQGAVAYEVEIADDETFAEPLVHARATTTSYRWDKVPDRRVYWRVRSASMQDARLGEWSESKEIDALFVPPEPQKPRPLSTAFSLDESVHLEWSASKIFTSYHGHDRERCGVCPSCRRQNRQRGAFRFSGQRSGVSYYWRVRGIDYAARDDAAVGRAHFRPQLWHRLAWKMARPHQPWSQRYVVVAPCTRRFALSRRSQRHDADHHLVHDPDGSFGQRRTLR